MFTTSYPCVRAVVDDVVGVIHFNFEVIARLSRFQSPADATAARVALSLESTNLNNRHCQIYILYIYIYLKTRGTYLHLSPSFYAYSENIYFGGLLDISV